MAFHEIQFPASISYGARGGPKFKTTIFELASGHEQRNIDWSSTRAEYDINNGQRTRGEMEKILAFFMARQGRAYPFRYKDWSDYIVSTQAIGTGDASATAFQVYKRYTSGSTTYDRTINKVVSGTDTVYRDGSATTAYSINYNTGVVTMSAAPGSAVVIAVSCQFDVPVRFDVDHLQIQITEFELFDIPVPIVEVRDIT